MSVCLSVCLPDEGAEKGAKALEAALSSYGSLKVLDREKF